MTARSVVRCDDLLAAFDWVNAAAPRENSAFVSRETGATHWGSNSADLEDELPEDIDDGRLYVAVPHKIELDLGRNLVLKFTDEVLHESSAEVAGFFLRPGGYRRFREFLGRKSRIGEWQEFERRAVERALREWADRHGLRIQP